MAADATIVSLRSDTAKKPAAKAPVLQHDAEREQPQQRAPQQPPPRELPALPAREPTERPVERASEPATAPKSGRRRWLRWVLFALLPIALIAGGLLVRHRRTVMSTDDSYVEADKVGVSTDVSGIVQGGRRRRQPAG